MDLERAKIEEGAAYWNVDYAIEQAEKEKERNKNLPTSICGLILYKCMLIIYYILAVASQFGMFTNGLPPRASYAYITSWLYELFSHLRTVYYWLWLFVDLFRGLTLTRAAIFIRRHVVCLWFVFISIIYFLGQIGYYHANK